MKSLAKPLTGISVTDGILASPREKRKLSASLDFWSTIDLDLAGLKLILAHVTSRLIAAHHVTTSGTDEVVDFFPQAREVAAAPLLQQLLGKTQRVCNKGAASLSLPV